MLKKLLVTLFAVSAFTVAATSAFAFSITTPGALGLTGYNPSNNCLMDYGSTAASGAYYAATIKHTQGNKAFGETSSSTSIYWIAANVGDPNTTGKYPITIPTSTDSATPTGSTWLTQ